MLTIRPLSPAMKPDRPSLAQQRRAMAGAGRSGWQKRSGELRKKIPLAHPLPPPHRSTPRLGVPNKGVERGGQASRGTADFRPPPSAPQDWECRRWAAGCLKRMADESRAADLRPPSAPQDWDADGGPKVYASKSSWRSSRPLLAYNAQSPSILTSRRCKDGGSAER